MRPALALWITCGLHCRVRASKVDIGVGWAPTHLDAASRVLDWADVGASDIFFELGCGDGRVAIEAARRGARVVCVEGDTRLLEQARLAAEEAKVVDRIELRHEDLLTTDLSQATVLFAFLLPTINARLLPAIERMAVGSRIVLRESQLYGWPCGERLRWPAGIEHGMFVKWVIGVLPKVPSKTILDEPPSEDAIIDHLLQCSAEDQIPDAVATAPPRERVEL